MIIYVLLALLIASNAYLLWRVRPLGRQQRYLANMVFRIIRGDEGRG